MPDAYFRTKQTQVSRLFSLRSDGLDRTMQKRRQAALCHAPEHATKSSHDSVTKCRYKFQERSVTASFVAVIHNDRTKRTEFIRKANTYRSLQQQPFAT